MRFFYLSCLLFVSTTLFSQGLDFSVSAIPLELKENANAVVRLNQKDLQILSRKLMITKTKNVITILNEKGLKNIDASEYFDKSSKVKSIEAIILDASGKEFKRIKRKDFKEVSVSEGSIITDNKLLYLDYTPVFYPFTVIFESEVETSNTAFIPVWTPFQDYYVSTEKSVINVNCLKELGFKYKEQHFSPDHSIEKTDANGNLSFVATNLKAQKYEEYTPTFLDLCPHVMMGLDLFHLEGVDGTAINWKEMGMWFSNSILSGTSEVPEATKAKIKQLVGEEKDAVRKAKIVYDYVQQKTRYVSIQEGIGGWRPMLAKDVDRLGYGDCKALTNYTKSLLEAVGVEAYYTRLYGSSTIKSVVQDFVSMQSNHVILAIPDGSNYIWLECTSQSLPFGFQGDFTDNRYALVLKPEGGEIIKTHEYLADESSQISKGNIHIDENGNLKGNVLIKSKGTQYDNKFHNQSKSSEELDKFYKDYFNHINNLKLKKINLSNNKETVEFSEDLIIEATEYASRLTGKLMFSLNVFNPLSNVPQRYRTRNNPFEISRGFWDYDEIIINIPTGYSIESKPENFEAEGVFGHYKTEYVILNENQLLYKRTNVATPGRHDKKEYDNFRKFREQIAKNDNAKIVLTKK